MDFVPYYDKSGPNAGGWDESESGTDPTPTGICQVCHDTTKHFKNNGAVSTTGTHNLTNNRYQGTNCSRCHSHSDNFTHFDYDADGTEAKNDCEDCHGHSTATTRNGGSHPAKGSWDSHQKHTEELGLACSDCHEVALTSQDASDNLLPSMETCYNCHDEDETDCTVCHTNPDEAGEYPRVDDLNAQFAHKVHAKSDEDCMNCHAGIGDKEQAGIINHVPDRDDCTNCHGASDYREDNSRCQQCHTKTFDFKPADHNGMWIKSHGVISEVEDETCSHCHQNNYCTACHQGDNLDRLAHPLNFVNNHGVMARGNKDNCLTCHEEHAFCIDCHQTQLVMPKSHRIDHFAAGDAHQKDMRKAAESLPDTIIKHCWNAGCKGYDVRWVRNGRGGWNGTSANLAIKIGMALDYTRIVLAGCPMDYSGNWYSPTAA